MEKNFQLAPSDISRFARFIIGTDKEDGCWEWRGHIKPNGYGNFMLYRLQTEGFKKSGSIHAHVVAYAMASGNHQLLADNRKNNALVVRHKCGNKKCVRFDHLEAGTQKQNIKDNEEQGRLLRGEDVGNSKLTEEQVREIYEAGRNWPRAPSGKLRSGLLPGLSEKYGVTRTMVSYIINGKWWAHATENSNEETRSY